MFLRVVRLIANNIARVLAKIEIIGMENLPPTGVAAVAASNHIGRLDAMLAVMLAGREDVIMMVAEKYQKYAFWRWMVRNLDAIWVNRFETDFHAVREVQKRLKRGGILGIAPEGTRSPNGAMQAAKHGAIYLAAKAGVPIVPVSICGTRDKEVVAKWKRLQRPSIIIHVGRPYSLPPFPRREERDAYLQAQSDEMMCQIAALLPPDYWGVYAEHPRLRELVEERLEIGD